MTVRKSSRVFFKIAGIISFITLSLCLIFACGILFEIAIFEDLFKTVYDTLYEFIETDLETLKFDFVITCIFSAIINFYAGRSYLNISKNKFLAVSSKRTIIFFIVIQFVFGMMFASMIAIIGLLLYKPKEYISNPQQKNNPFQTDTESTNLSKEAMEFCATNIAELNKLLEENKITKEEYNNALNNLLSVDYYSEDKNS